MGIQGRGATRLATGITRKWLFGAAASLGAALLPATAHATPGLVVLHAFDFAEGQFPEGRLVQGSDGSLFGTTYAGGSNGLGTAFKVTTGGAHSIVHSFTGMDGNSLNSGMLLGADGSFYGTTPQGSFCVGSVCSGFGGTVFKLSADGALTTLHLFNDLAGGFEPGALVDGGDGNLYGTTDQGGAGSLGTVFKVTPAGTFVTTHAFAAGEGSQPSGALTRGSDGNLYGATRTGGASNSGTLFRVTPGGTLTTVHTFNGSDGASPSGNLVLGKDGNLYGATGAGGPNGAGTLYKLTPRGRLTTLHGFNGGDGSGPLGVVQVADGSFYGVTGGGGDEGGGVLFHLGTDGSVITIHLFQPVDGTHPGSVPILGSDGNLYGTTETYGGAPSASGSVYQFDPRVPQAPALNLSKTCFNEFDTCFTPINTTIGQSVALDWNSANVTSCFASGAWHGQKATGGHLSFTPLAAGVFTYRLTCVGPSGNVQASTTLTVAP